MRRVVSLRYDRAMWTKVAVGALSTVIGCAGSSPSAAQPQSRVREAQAPAPQNVVSAPSPPAPVDTSAQDALRFADWCAVDRAERAAAREAVNARARQMIESMQVDAEKAAVAQKRDADAATQRAEYIRKNCHEIGVPKDGPSVCVDEHGFLHQCERGLEVYLQCPASGPKELRGVIGGPSRHADPSRIARARTPEPSAQASAVASPREPTKDERCRPFDDAVAR